MEGRLVSVAPVWLPATHDAWYRDARGARHRKPVTEAAPVWDTQPGGARLAEPL